MKTFKMCSKCGRVANWDSYFNVFFCDCGEMITNTNANRSSIKKVVASDKQIHKSVLVLK